MHTILDTGSRNGDARMSYDRAGEPTLASEWHAASRGAITDELLDWPPDVFALTNVILTRSEAFRFALSPIREWPPEGYPDWGRTVVEGGLRWAGWAGDRHGPLPGLVGQEWAVVKERADMPLEQLAQGLDWRMCVALLTLHAMADEACAGLDVALDTSPGSASHWTFPTQTRASTAPVAGRGWSGPGRWPGRPAPLASPAEGPHPTHR